MSLAAFNQYRLQIARGTCDLALIQAAETKKYVTAAEASQLRAFWHATYDVIGLAASVTDAREVAVTWTSPSSTTTTSGTYSTPTIVRVTRSVAGQESTANVNAANLGYTFPADLGPEAGDVLVSAVIVAPNGYEGPASTAEAFLPDAPEEPVAGEDEPAAEEPPAGG